MKIVLGIYHTCHNFLNELPLQGRSLSKKLTDSTTKIALNINGHIKVFQKAVVKLGFVPFILACSHSSSQRLN